MNLIFRAFDDFLFLVLHLWYYKRNLSRSIMDIFPDVSRYQHENISFFVTNYNL